MIPPRPLSPELLSELEAYYAGRLSDEAVRHLRSRIVGDADLAAAVEQWEAVLRHGLLTPAPEALAERRRLRVSLAGLEAKQPRLRAARPARSPYRWWGLAAAVLLVVLAAWWLLDRRDAATLLAYEYFTWEPREEALLGPEADDADPLLAYDREEFTTAWPLLVRDIGVGRLDSVNLLYAGVAALGAGEPREAKALLSTLIDLDRYPYERPAAHYHLALAELQLGRVNAARAQLRLVTGDPEREARARQLLQELEGLEGGEE